MIQWSQFFCVFQLKEQGVFSPQSIARVITQGARNELEKIRAIWVWLCQNIGKYIHTFSMKLQENLNTK